MNFQPKKTISLKNNVEFANHECKYTNDKSVNKEYDFNSEFKLDVINKELFDTTAEKCARILSNSKSNKGTQLRRFYDELVMWYERVHSDDEAFQNVLPFIFMIKSKVAYAVGRDNVNKDFQNFMNCLIDQITNRNTLKNAKLFMEAVMGFYKQYRPKDN